MPQTHKIKCHPAPFSAIARGDKRFEMRKNDRDYQTGDTLIIGEWDPEKWLEPRKWGLETNGDNTVTGLVAPPQAPGMFTGNEVTARVTYCLHGPKYGVPEGYVCMSLEVGETRLSEYTITATFTPPGAAEALEEAHADGVDELRRAFDALKGAVGRRLDSKTKTEDIASFQNLVEVYKRVKDL